LGRKKDFEVGSSADLDGMEKKIRRPDRIAACSLDEKALFLWLGGFTGSARVRAS
jgi:hypothetical protein